MVFLKKTSRLYITMLLVWLILMAAAVFPLCHELFYVNNDN